MNSSTPATPLLATQTLARAVHSKRFGLGEEREREKKETLSNHIWFCFSEISPHIQLGLKNKVSSNKWRVALLICTLYDEITRDVIGYFHNCIENHLCSALGTPNEIN